MNNHGKMQTHRQTDRQTDRHTHTHTHTYLQHQTCWSSSIIAFNRNKCTKMYFFVMTNVSCHGIGALITLHTDRHN